MSLVLHQTQRGEAVLPALTPPFTLVGWFWYDSPPSGYQGLCQLFNHADSHRYELAYDAGELLAYSEDSSFSDQSAISGVPTGAWFHGAAVFTSNSSRRVYLNGVAGSAGVGPLTTTYPTRARIGTAAGLGGDSTSHRAAEVACIQAGLTQDEILQLASGLSPAAFVHRGIVFYEPCIRRFNENPRGEPFATTGSPPAAEHPRVVYVTGQSFSRQPACAWFANTVRGASDGLAIDQPGGAGRNYPFRTAHALRELIGDCYLLYRDDDCELLPPFSFRWLYGFGCNDVTGDDDNLVSQLNLLALPGSPGPFSDLEVESGEIPITPVHASDLVVEDSAGTVVFDTRDADRYVVNKWGAAFLVHEWANTDSDEVLRLVQRNARESGEPMPIFDVYIEPVNALLDARTCAQQLPRLRSLRKEGGDMLQGQISLLNGYNTTLELATTAAADGGRNSSTITFNAGPGLGDGQFPTGCEDEDEIVVRYLGGIGPRSDGNFAMDAANCYKSERPVFEEVNASPRRVAITAGALQLSNDCGPCCDCGDYVKVYEALRRLRDRLAALFERANVTRLQYAQNASRFTQQADCRRNNPIRATATRICPDEVAFTIGFCNNTDECVTNLIMPISFDYLEGGLSAGTALDPPESQPAKSQAFRAGNASDECCENFQGERKDFYRIGGTYPHLYAAWDRVDPGGTAYVMFSLLFSPETMSVTDDLVEFVVDAYSIAGGPTGDCPIPIDDYTPGSGPGPTAIAHRIAEPRKYSITIARTPCETSPEFSVNECY